MRIWCKRSRKKKSLGKRSRYYHSQMVMEYLERGEEYETIPDTFVIFVCDFDPFGQGLYCYIFRNECQEDRKVKLKDGSSTIFLNTQGRNETEVPEGLVRFLKFVTADLEESEDDFQDELVRQFQETIRRIKTDRQMGERYMIFEEMLKEEKQEGRLEAKKEDIFELLEELGEIPRDLWEKIGKLEDITKLKILHKKAARADSISAFEKEAEPYYNSEK